MRKCAGGNTRSPCVSSPATMADLHVDLACSHPACCLLTDEAHSQAADRSLANLVLAKGAAHQARRTPSKSPQKASSQAVQLRAHGSATPKSPFQRAPNSQLPQPQQAHTPPRASGNRPSTSSRLSPGAHFVGGFTAQHQSAAVYEVQGLVESPPGSDRSSTQAHVLAAAGGVLVSGASPQMRHHHGGRQTSNDEPAAVYFEGARNGRTGHMERVHKHETEHLSGAAATPPWMVRGDTLVAPTPEQLGALRRHLKVPLCSSNLNTAELWCRLTL